MKITVKAQNYLKALCAETTTNAKSGHLGVCLGASSILFALFKDHYNFDVSDTDFLNRDRLVLSAGHASPLYYSLLSMFGFNVSLQDLKDFRHLGSKTPAYPEYKLTEGVEVTTSLAGQGVANAVGMAIAEAVMEERFNTVGFDIINNYTYCFVSDGDLMEGVALEAASLAGNLKLNRLILLYDSNEVTNDGSLSLCNRENVAKKFKAMGWNVIKVARGNNYSFCTHAIARAKKSNKPTIIIFNTTIGIGTQKEGTSAVHNAVLSQEELATFKENLGVKESFYIPSDVRELCMASTRRGKLNHEKWNQDLAMYSSTHPELYKALMAFFDRKKINFDRIMKNISKYDGLSLRKINHYALSELAYQCPQLLGGTADVAPTSMTFVDNAGNFSAGYRRGKNIHFGVREHAMSAICNGIALYEDFITFDSTYLAYSTYSLPAIQLRSKMKLPVMSFFTHDSIYLGKDGPSHQIIEQLGALRGIVGNTVYRPCDYKELVAGYQYCVKNYEPVSFALSRQNISSISGTSFEGALLGGYLIENTSAKPNIVLVASGAEVELAVKVANELRKKYQVNVVSMPSIEVFEKQSSSYKNKIISKDAELVLSIEASNDTKWLKILGKNGESFAINEYLSDGDGEQLYEKAGFTVKNLVKFAENKLKSQK
ncbi:MAG: transketolase-like TK C-terminal-containing protein [Candidatus Caccovivens sp.]